LHVLLGVITSKHGVTHGLYIHYMCLWRKSWYLIWTRMEHKYANHVCSKKSMLQ